MDQALLDDRLGCWRDINKIPKYEISFPSHKIFQVVVLEGAVFLSLGEQSLSSVIPSEQGCSLGSGLSASMLVGYSGSRG